MTIEDDTIEPLAQLARFSWAFSPMLCDPAHGCADYHRCWSTVRWLMQGGALPSESAFFISEIGRLARQGATRVLVSGAADTGVLAMVQQAFAGSGFTLEPVLVDRCQTTVIQNRIYCAWLGIDARFHCRDLVELDCAPVDLVVAHSFLHFFPEPQRQRVIANWHRLLKPGGRLILVNSVTSSPSSGPPARSEGSMDKSIARLLRAATGAGLSRADADELADCATRFWRSEWWSKPYVTAAGLQRGLETAGFATEKFLVSRNASVAPTRAYVQSGRPRERVNAVARKQ